MKLAEFEKVVNAVLAGLPEEFRQILKKEKIEIISREKIPEAVRERFRSRIVFGIFAGVSRKDKRTFSIQTEPTRIELYKESFEKLFGSNMTDTIKERIAKTVIHEIAHYLGFSEEDIASRGY